MRQKYHVLAIAMVVLLMVLSACSSADPAGTAPEGADASETVVEDATAEAAPTEAAVEESDEEAATEAAPTEEPAEESDEEREEAETIEPLFAEFDPANFTNSTNIDNEWSPLQPGMQWAYEGESLDGDEMVPHRIEFTVTDLTKEIDGVRVVVAWVVDIINGEEVVESELSFYAQDDEGTVWYLGEYPEEYEEGELVAAPTWVSGVEEAVAGVKMVKEPQLDTPIYFQGWAPAVEWSDFGIVARMEEEVCVAVDCYQDVLVIDESSLEEIGAFQQKLYAKGVGNIKVEWTGDDATQETLELVDFAELDAEALAEINALALEQEERAYENSPDVYGTTAPME